MAPFWDGTSWTLVSLAELSLALDSNSGHTGYHQSGKNFDLFLDYNGGSPRLVSGPAWTNDTTPAVDVVRQNGIWLNVASMTARFGTSSGDTATIAASRATWLGTFRASANGQTEMSLAPAAAAGGSNNKLFLWNAYNRRPLAALVRESADSWTYATASWRAFNNSNSNRLSYVVGLNEDPVAADVRGLMVNSAGTGILGIGVDSTSAFSGLTGAGGGSTANVPASASYNGYPGRGFHFLQMLEQSNSGTTTFYGDAGAPSNFQQGMLARLAM